MNARATRPTRAISLCEAEKEENMIGRTFKKTVRVSSGRG